MKQLLRFWLSLSLVTILGLFFTIQADAQVVLNPDVNTRLSLEQNAFSQIVVHNTFSTFDHFTVNTTEGQFTEFMAEGYSFTDKEGFPKLPVMRQLIEIPVGAELEVKVISSTVREFALSDLGITNPIMPVQPPMPKSADQPGKFSINRLVYQRNAYQNQPLASAEILGFLRGSRIARLDISPVDYNPVTGTIRIYEDLVIEVKFTGGNYGATAELQERTRSPYFGINQKTFLNALPTGTGMRDPMTRYPVKMVIVSAPMFHDALQPYIDWKTRKGFTIIEAYTDNPEVGTTTASIKDYLTGLYNAGTPEDPAPSFVLFVGDVAQIPAFSQSGHVTDLYYCEYTGDYFPDVYYGRFSATTVAQLQPQIDKTLMYEQYTFPDPSFLGESLMVSGVDASFAPIHGNGQINYGTTNYFNEAHGFLSHNYLYPASGSSSSAIIQNVSNGVAYGNYTAHGSSSGWGNPSFVISDIPGLQNAGKYPLLVGNCCLTSTYNVNCFGEELLRAQDKGAIGYIGASNSTYWDEDFYFGVGVGPIVLHPTYESTTLGTYDRAFHDHGETFADWYVTQGQMFVAGNLAVTQGSPGMALYYWQVYCLMGDPSLMIYWGVPAAMSVNYEPLMPLQSDEFTVNAAPYAYVAISKDGILHGSALADETGTALVSLSPISVPGEAEIIVTAQNLQPFIGTVMVASPEGPYIMLQSQMVNDASANNNQLPEFGEEFGFNMALKNVGNTAGQTLSVEISSSSPSIEILKGQENWPDIQPGEIVMVEAAFNVKAADFLPDQHSAEFMVNVTNGIEIWTSGFTLKLNAPKLQASDLLVDDYFNGIGNGNRRMDPGENVVLSIPVINVGHCPAANTISHLFTDSEGIDIKFIQYVNGNIGATNTKSAIYNVAISPDIPIGTRIELFFVTESGLYTDTRIFNPSVGLIIEDFEKGDFSAFEWENNSPKPWTITNLGTYAGNFSARSGAIGNNTSTDLQISINLESEDNISFARSVSSESGYDFLKFYIDGVEKGSWSGSADWEVVSFPVNAGNHTFKWTYKKDQSATGGQDAAFIDDILFPSGASSGHTTDLNAVAFSYPQAICAGDEARLYAFVRNANSSVNYAWTPTDLISNPEIFNPVAVLNDTTTFTVQVSTFLQTADTTLLLPAIPAPETPTIEIVGNVLISSAIAGNQWYNPQGPIENAIYQQFEPQETDYYHVVVTAPLECGEASSDELYVTVVDAHSSQLEKQFIIYPNPVAKEVNLIINLLSTEALNISLLDVTGQEIRQLHKGQLGSGNHTLSFNVEDIAPGIYLIRVETSTTSQLSKLIITK
jgi:hypothetical protein